MKIDLAQCRAALQSPRVRAFLRLIREGETSQGEIAYRTIVGGGQFEDFADHPRQLVSLPSLGVNSTAAGAYQFLARTWDGCAKYLGLPDFSPESQDLAAVYLIAGRNALQDVLNGDLDAAIDKCRLEWASLPGSPYGQPTMDLSKARRVYEHWLAVETAQAPPESPIDPEAIPVQPEAPAESPEPFPFPASNRPPRYAPAGEADPFAEDPSYRPEASMPLAPIVGALLPSLIEAVPKLGKLFGSGSAVAERNVKAAELAMQIAQQATGAVNAQAAVEAVKADPAKAQAATRAIESRWLELTETGGGGVEGARKADAAWAAGPWHAFMHSPSFWVAVLLIPLVYMIVANVVGLIGKPLSDEVRSAISNGVVGLILGGLIGYYYGQTTSRNRAPSP